MISLNLKKHCIETEIKKQYNKAVRDYFKAAGAHDRKELEQRIELFKKALETLNFSELRGKLAALSGHAGRKIQITLDSTGHVAIYIDGVPLNLNREG